ncbi:MAG: hypothetical protein LBB88_01830 [Planctomycetaceae bacterium]|nr:hypothetical protein [Planctomycetaceae bacterium]
MNSYKLQINKCRDAMLCVSLFDQKITDVETQCFASHCSIKRSRCRDAMPCVSTLGLEI